MSKSNGNSATRAAGLLETFRKGSTLLALAMALELIQPLETLNTALQGREVTVSGMKKAVASVQAYLQKRRSDSSFETLFEKTSKVRAQLDLDKIAPPRIRRPPKRFTGVTGPTEVFVPDSVVQYYKIDYFKLLDTALAQLSSRTSQDGLNIYEKLETCLLSGEINDACMQYPEINSSALKTQLALFKMQFRYSSTDEAASVMRS